MLYFSNAVFLIPNNYVLEKINEINDGIIISNEKNKNLKKINLAKIELKTVIFLTFINKYKSGENKKSVKIKKAGIFNKGE